MDDHDRNNKSEPLSLSDTRATSLKSLTSEDLENPEYSHTYDTLDEPVMDTIVIILIDIKLFLFLL